MNKKSFPFFFLFFLCLRYNLKKKSFIAFLGTFQNHRYSQHIAVFQYVSLFTLLSRHPVTSESLEILCLTSFECPVQESTSMTVCGLTSQSGSPGTPLYRDPDTNKSAVSSQQSAVSSQQSAVSSDSQQSQNSQGQEQYAKYINYSLPQPQPGGCPGGYSHRPAQKGGQ